MTANITINSFRANSDDDRFVIPELVQMDMYKLGALKPLIPDLGVVLDCGAHIGIFSLLFNANYPNHKILAFEPSPDNYYHLEKNCAENKNITIHQAAVGTASGTSKLFDQGATGRYSFTPDTQGESDLPSVDVAVLNVAEIIAEQGKKNFLVVKLDLEGYEAEVIKALPPEAVQLIDLLILEEHHIPIDHDKLKANGLSLLFNPFNMPRHFVYFNRDRQGLPK